MMATLPPMEPGALRMFPLRGLLPDDYTLTLHQKLDILSLQDANHTIIVQTILTGTEQRLLSCLVENYPDYAPYEQLYAAYHGQTVELAYKSLEQALKYDAWDVVMKNVRNTLFRLRVKIADMGIDIKNISLTGYQLFPIGTGVRSNY